MSHLGRVIVYGGRGALGSKCVSNFKAHNFWVGSIGPNANTEADVNIIVNPEDSLVQQESSVLDGVESALGESKLDAVICVAGGWTGGNATKDFAKNFDLVLHQSVYTSVISASVAAKFLKEGGLLVFSGAKAALEPTPDMIGYGAAKATVHNLVRSLGAKNSGMPKSSLAVCILPATLDTPMNRKAMPKGDISSWTPLEFVADTLFNWTVGKNRPGNGSLMQVITKNFNTEMIPANACIEAMDKWSCEQCKCSD